MRDFTSGPITRHLLKTTGFTLVTMVFQTLYLLIDLYWVGRLSTEAVAAVGVAGNLTFIVMALSQMLGVGTTTVISHAAGRRDGEQCTMLFNQAQVLATLVGVLFLAAGMAIRWPYARAMSADAGTAALAAEYLLWFIPAMSLQFPMVAMGSALRAVGNFKVGMIVSTASIIVNMVVAPFLIFGWGTGVALGVGGAALASLIAVGVAALWLLLFFRRSASVLRFHRPDWRPRPDIWRRMLSIGLPAGVEFGLIAIYLALVYTVTRPFGAAAQAAFGIGMRIVQSGFLPVVALGFSVAPVAGQNFGAQRHDRVRATFTDAAAMATGVMVLLILVCHLVPRALLDVFTDDPQVLAIGEQYLRIVSWSFWASGLIFVASSTFQAMGNTVPSLVASGIRIVIVAVPVLALSRAAGFQLAWIWWLSVASVLVQLVVALGLLRREFSRKLQEAKT